MNTKQNAPKPASNSRADVDRNMVECWRAGYSLEAIAANYAGCPVGQIATCLHLLGEQV